MKFIDRRSSAIVLLRLVSLPVVLVALYVWRAAIFEPLWLHFKDTAPIVVMELYSTIRERSIAALAAAGAFILILNVDRRVSGQGWLAIAVSTLSAWWVLSLTESPSPFWWAIAIGLILVVNCAPIRWIEYLLTNEKWNRVISGVFVLGIGVSELLAPRPFAHWAYFQFYGRLFSAERTWIVGLPGAAVASALLVVLIPFNTWRQVNLRLPLDSKVRVVYGGLAGTEASLTWLWIDHSRRRLYVCGNGLQHLSWFELNEPAFELIESGIPTSGAQFCGSSSHFGEIYVFNMQENALQIVDTQSLEVKREVALSLGGDREDGEVFLEVDSNGNIVAARESLDLEDYVRDKQAAVVDRDLGKLVRRLNLRPGYMVPHPHRSVMYADYFWGLGELHEYDLINDLVIKRVPTDKYVDRMALDIRRRELLVTSPVYSRVLRYDLESLEARAHIDTTFGVRGLAIDGQRDLLLTSSFASNMLDIIDLNTYQSIAKYRLGPWLRDIAIDEQRGIAYVSSTFSLYEVRYGESLATVED